MTQPSEDADTEARPLAEAIVALAEIPDDMPGRDRDRSPHGREQHHRRQMINCRPL